jgi:hypothetical protein
VKIRGGKNRARSDLLLCESQQQKQQTKIDREARSETGASKINFCGSWHEQIHKRLRIREDLKKNLAT